MNNVNIDILNTLSNLSSDEVFTPPEVVNKMLDLLPQELFQSENTTFLDPCSKSGVFLREIVKRLNEGLKNKIPNLQDRITHILSKQIFGISITELCHFLTKRTLYCSKYANNDYSIGQGSFKDEDGNIYYKKCAHIFDSNGLCIKCGASKKALANRNSDENYAYSFIHESVEQITRRYSKMKFDVIIGNPPYSFKTAEAENQQNADPLYDKFVLVAEKLHPHYLSMIIPSRWMSSGKSSLNEFRNSMLKDQHIKVMHDFLDATDCFPNVEIKGGVCYFLRDENYSGDCQYFLHNNGKIEYSFRKLDNFNIGRCVRDSKAFSIISKVLNSPDFTSFKSIAGSQTPFGIVTSFNDYSKEKTAFYNTKIYIKGGCAYTNFKYVTKGFDLVDCYKVFAPKAVGDGNIESDKIIPIIGEKGSICTQTYIAYGKFESQLEAENLKNYMETKFFHFLLGQLKITMQMAPNYFELVPMQNFNEGRTDVKLYKKYNLTQEEINYIENLVWSKRKTK